MNNAWDETESDEIDTLVLPYGKPSYQGKTMLTEQPKGALLSGSILGSIISLIPALDILHQSVMELPVGLIPHSVQAPMIVVGALLAIYKRITAKAKIKGVI